MYLGVLILPLISVISVGFFGRLLGKTGAMIVANVFIGLTFCCSGLMFYEVCLSNTKVIIEVGEWFRIGVFKVMWSFLFDSVTCIMLFVITSISSLVHLYSTSYMEKDPHVIRFMSYLSVFTLFMIILVTSNNLLQLFLGWEGVGVSSYLLINFWFTREAANQSAIKAIIVNRVGDMGILLAILSIMIVFKSVDIGVICGLAEYFGDRYFLWNGMQIHSLTLISLGFFIGAVGKSAQLGLHTWLPDAMEGPTPVSALIHAATMVTAGVFVLVRFSAIIEAALLSPLIIGLLGGITGFFAGTIGAFQNDLKRVVAYSTCSQLGYMVVCCGLSGYSVALFHLMNHAFFKALLFLSAGSVIHALSDEQDMRKMGGLKHVLPFTYTMFVIGSLALMGFPYTSGYYSKDLILELAASKFFISHLGMYWLLAMGASCTAFYSVRLIYLTFLGETRIDKTQLKNVHEGPIQMWLPMLLLSFGSLFAGYLCKDMFIGLGTPFFGTSITSYKYPIFLEAEFLDPWVKLLPICLSIGSATIAYCYYEYFNMCVTFKWDFLKDASTLFFKLYFLLFSRKWFFDVLYNKVFVRYWLFCGYDVFFKNLDRGIIEFYGPTGLVRDFSYNRKFILQHMNGYVFKGVFFMILSVICFLFFMILLSKVKEESGGLILINLYLFWLFLTKDELDKEASKNKIS